MAERTTVELVQINPTIPKLARRELNKATTKNSKNGNVTQIGGAPIPPGLNNNIDHLLSVANANPGSNKNLVGCTKSDNDQGMVKIKGVNM